jgi:hypothetical protein
MRFTSIVAAILVLATSLATPLVLSQAASSTSQPARPDNSYSTPPARAAGPRSTPPMSSPPQFYSGISGPGLPVSGDGAGGYRSGNEGVIYNGPDPKPGWNTKDWGNRANGSAVKSGLMPALKPIWDLHLRDTTIALADDGFYYMTGSSGDNIWDINDGVELWKSPDLKSWSYFGLVWSVDRDGTWEKQYRRVWAPEIHFIKHNFFIVYCLQGQGGGTGILMSKTGKAEGPYVNPIAADKPLTGGIDATLFEDDDGKVYFTSGSGGTIYLMKDDMSGFDGPGHRVLVNADANYLAGRTKLGHEGASLFKANGKYYLGGADTYEGRYSSICAIADNVFGPYSKVHEAVPTGGGTNYFRDKDGIWWDCLFGNDDQLTWREKPGIVRIEFAADGTIKVARDQPDFVLVESARKAN